MPQGGELELRHPPSLAQVTVHVPAGGRKAIIFAAFLVLHAVALKACIDTSGDSYEVAVQRLRKINREHALNGTKPEDMPPQDVLPTTWAPNAWASAGLFGTLSLHALFYLLCHWKVKFRAAALFSPATSVREGCYVQITPHAHRGKAAMVPIWLSDASVRLGFSFQRQRYEYHEPEGDEEVGEVQLVKCPVDNPVASYLKGTGLRADQLDELKEQFGDNQLQVEMPSFLQCYKEQLLTPLVIFQVFVALLWAADDFISYTLMQMGFILMFESTTVFQRLKTMKMLNSMGTKSYGIKVFRGKEWTEVLTSDLLPGDLIELTAVPPPVAKVEPGAEGAAAAAAAPPEAQVAPDIVPCDCVILRGEAVVSEASLTGESAPQMKDALVPLDRPLELQGADRVHSLFSGTRLLRASEGRGNKAAQTRDATSQVPATPDGGCLAYVVRTGFSSSQGELLQMIEFSQEKVQGDTKEVMYALLLLLAFALVAAGYVLKTGLEKGEKTPHELLIKCIIILTAVVPRQLPMQMAFAVNTALMSLVRNGIYCTEPYRVPFAGKLTHCYFDKTGTLTTDTLVPVGVVNAEDNPSPILGYPDQSMVSEASAAAALVLAACHSLVAVEGKLAGDPIEVAALEGVGWMYDADAETATPVIPGDHEAAAIEDKKDADSADKKKKSSPKGLAPGSVESAHVQHRFHFASQLQRMSVIVDISVAGQAKVKAASSSRPVLESGRYCLVKGSPEAVGKLLSKDAAPPWFDKAHTSLAESGLRILALAFRKLTEAELGTDVVHLVREDMECELLFAGFIAFECKARADSGMVLGALSESGHRVAMLTGDSPLTALHIARTCGIVGGALPGLLLTLSSPGEVEWVVATGDTRGEKRPLSTPTTELTKEFALVVTGDALDAAVEAQPDFWLTVDEIRVFARMTPQGKALVIRQMQKQGSHVLMCGDGGNDVGALKQADVGLALLAGYGNVNTTAVVDDKPKALEDGAPANKGAELALNEHQAALAKRTTQAGKARQAYMWAKQKELNTMHQQWLEEEMQKRLATTGEAGMIAQMAAQGGAVKSVLSRYTGELKRVMREYDLKNGNIYDEKEGDPKKDPMEEMKKKMESMESSQGLPMVRPGDASVAAPFTSKAPSVKSCVDLIRQGRCTLLSALQQQQIMMLNCIINAYVLSALSLEGSRSSERQLMASNWLLTTASLAFAYASPCDRMHPVRPLRSLFHPAVFVSMLGQSAIHLACMVTAVRMCRSTMEEGSAERLAGWEGPSLKDVSEFWRIQKLKRRGVIESEEEEDWTKMMMQMWFQPFLPNLMNTVVFLVETAQTVAILFVNYKGQPWMRGVMENRALFLSVFLVAAGVAAAAWEFLPEVNVLVHLSPFPDDVFRWWVMGLVTMTLVGTFIWDRLCIMVFAPEIFQAMLQSAKQTTFINDILPIFKTAGKVLVVFLVLGTGNLLLAGAAFWWYKRATREVETPPVPPP
mmetsp:Transcript_91496/g.261977  ORF Transcript_91496/g.261977 Transcript_91496/m.261977 type:complete len:1471 (+) Transcript_91496:72-4484(+)